MKSIFASVLFGKNNLISGIIAIGVVASIALGCNCGKNLDLGSTSSSDNSSTTTSNTSSDDSTFKSDGSVPPISSCETMVHDLTSDFADAIRSNDWSDIYSKSSTDFQSSYTEQQMKDAFKVFVNNKGRVTPVLDKSSSMTPDFSPAPYIRTEKGLSILVLNGKFATKPVPMTFEYEFVQRSGEWKMLKLIVKLV